MKNKGFACVLALALAFSCCGCSGSEISSESGPVQGGNAEAEGSGISPESGPAQGSGSEAGAEGSEGSGQSEAGASGQEEGEWFLSLADMPWKDNSLDAYSALLNVPLRDTKEEGALEGGIAAYFCGPNGASMFKKHLFPKAEDGWDEIKTVTDQGEEVSYRLAFREGHNQAWMAGGIAGSDHYVMLGEIERGEDGKLSYRFFETDASMAVQREFYADCLDENDYEFPRQLQEDAEGNLHAVTSRVDNSTHYYILGPEGALLKEVSPAEGFPEGQEAELTLLYDGSVGYRSGSRLWRMNLETGTAEILADADPGWLACTLLDEKTLIYADSSGLYKAGISGGSPEVLYAFGNHGVSASDVKVLQVNEDGSIGLVCLDSGGANYLKLEPTSEEVEIQEVTLAVSSSSSKKYQAAVAAFNKKYPAFRIRLKTYAWNDTGLLTELGAGEGPALVDASLVGFEESAEWWEPLDKAFRLMGLGEELIPQAVEAGRIDGTLYGVVTDFSLDTVVTFAPEPEEWDYDTFLSCFDEGDSFMKSPYLPVTGSDGHSFLTTFFCHGMEGKYLFDGEEGTTNFDGDGFRKALRLAKAFQSGERQGDAEDLRQGASLCAAVSIRRPEDLACLRIWGGDGLRFIGYPSEEGSRHYIEGGDPLVLRSGAAPWEKRLACSFLRFLLSYEAQMEAVSAAENQGYGMSVRRDVLEEQVARMDEHTFTNLIGFPQFDLGDQADRERDGAALQELLEQAVPRQDMPRELVNIFTEELVAYLSGGVTEDMVIDHLENRVSLYLSERK